MLMMFFVFILGEAVNVGWSGSSLPPSAAVCCFWPKTETLSSHRLNPAGKYLPVCKTSPDKAPLCCTVSTLQT